jgi:ketosteroid isomerase-like protein
MTTPNGELVARGMRAATRRPEPDYAQMNELYHPEHELISLVDALEGGAHRGARGFRDWMRNSEQTLPWESTITEISEIDAARCLVVTPTRSTGRSSGVVLDDQRLACIVTVRDGKIVRTEVYGSREQALRATGLGPAGS